MNKFNYSEYINSMEPNWKKTYTKLFSKYNLLESLVFSNVLVVETKEKYMKLGRQCFPKKPTETTVEIIGFEYYLNGITGVLFFHDRVSLSATKWGYIPARMTCTNPTNDVKISRSFQYIDLDRIYQMGGFRERDVLDNLDRVELISGDNWIKFFHTDGEHTFEYSIDRKTICG